MSILTCKQPYLFRELRGSNIEGKVGNCIDQVCNGRLFCIESHVLIVDKAIVHLLLHIRKILGHHQIQGLTFDD